MAGHTWKVGDKARVTVDGPQVSCDLGSSWGKGSHRAGDIVTIMTPRDSSGDYETKDAAGKYWWIHESQLEPGGDFVFNVGDKAQIITDKAYHTSCGKRYNYSEVLRLGEVVTITSPIDDDGDYQVQRSNDSRYHVNPSCLKLVESAGRDATPTPTENTTDKEEGTTVGIVNLDPSKALPVVNAKIAEINEAYDKAADELKKELARLETWPAEVAAWHTAMATAFLSGEYRVEGRSLYQKEDGPEAPQVPSLPRSADTIKYYLDEMLPIQRANAIRPLRDLKAVLEAAAENYNIDSGVYATLVNQDVTQPSF